MAGFGRGTMAALAMAALGCTTAVAAAADRRFDDFPAGPAYHGRAGDADFGPQGSRFHDFRTRLRDAVAHGPDFAGRFAVARVGCGTGCTTTYLVDVPTGRVAALSFGGEGQQEVGIAHEVGSRLLRAHWIEGDDPDRRSCVVYEAVLADGRLTAETRRRAGGADDCRAMTWGD